MRPSFDANSLAGMLRSKPEVEAALLGRGNIVGVGIGLRDPGDPGQTELAYLVYVDGAAVGPAPAVDIPQTVAGHPTRVVASRPQAGETGLPRTTIQQDDNRYDPLVGGIAISDIARPGALGVVVKRTIGPTHPQYILSCYHVLERNASPVYQPDTAQSADLCAMTVAGVFGNLPVRRADGDHIVFVDAAVAEVFPSRRDATDLYLATIGNLDGWMQIDAYLLNATAFKRGPETLLTAGIITDIAATMIDPFNYYIYRNVLIVEADDFALGGDSGSIVYVVVRDGDTVARGVVGLLTGRTIRDPRQFGVIPVDAIIQHLNVVFDANGNGAHLSGDVAMPKDLPRGLPEAALASVPQRAQP